MFKGFVKVLIAPVFFLSRKLHYRRITSKLEIKKLTDFIIQIAYIMYGKTVIYSNYSSVKKEDHELWEKFASDWLIDKNNLSLMSFNFDILGEGTSVCLFSVLRSRHFFWGSGSRSPRS